MLTISSDCPFILQDLKSKRNPRLVPYVLLDERTKKSNRDSLREAIRTLIGYGYNIEPSDQEGGEFFIKMHSCSNYSTHDKLPVEVIPMVLHPDTAAVPFPQQDKWSSGSASTRSASLE